MHVSREPTDADLDELRGLETAMWRSETRGDRSWMDQRLARDFAEFGRSGRRYTRAEILDLDVGEIHATLPLRDLQCRRLGGGVVLVTYQAEVDGHLANRSSISRLTDAGSQIEFHQGTPTSAMTPPTHPLATGLPYPMAGGRGGMGWFQRCRIFRSCSTNERPGIRIARAERNRSTIVPTLARGDHLMT